MNHPVLRLMAVDLVVILAVYLFVFYGETGAGIFILGQSFIVDVLSAGAFGLFTLLNLITFLCIKLASRPLDFLSTGGLVATIFLVVLLKKILMVAFLFIFPQEISLSAMDFLYFVLSALFTGLIAPFIFHYTGTLERSISGVERDI